MINSDGNDIVRQPAADELSRVRGWMKWVIHFIMCDDGDDVRFDQIRSASSPHWVCMSISFATHTQAIDTTLTTIEKKMLAVPPYSDSVYLLSGLCLLPFLSHLFSHLYFFASSRDLSH